MPIQCDLLISYFLKTHQTSGLEGRKSPGISLSIMLGLDTYSLHSLSATPSFQASAPPSVPGAKIAPPSPALQAAVSCIESEVAQLTSERNQLCTQLCDLRTLLRKLTRDLATEASSELRLMVLSSQHQLQAKAEAQAKALATAEKASGHMGLMADLWSELELI